MNPHDRVIVLNRAIYHSTVKYGEKMLEILRSLRSLSMTERIWFTFHFPLFTFHIKPASCSLSPVLPAEVPMKIGKQAGSGFWSYDYPSPV